MMNKELSMRSKAYQFTVLAANSPKISDLRSQIKSANKDLKQLFQHKDQIWMEIPTKFDSVSQLIIAIGRSLPHRYRLRIKVRGRLGSNNPYASLYAKGGLLWRSSSQDIRPEHSSRFDVYTHEEIVWK